MAAPKIWAPTIVMVTDDMYHFDYLAHLRITHPTDSLDDIIGLFAEKPVLHLKKGEARRNKLGGSLGRKAYFSIVSWRLHKEATTSSTKHPLDEVLSDCLDALANKRQQLKTILKIAGSIRVEIAIRPSNAYCVWALSPLVMRKLSRLGVQVDFCFVVPPGMLVAKHSHKRGTHHKPLA